MLQPLFYSLLMQMGEDMAHFILFRFQVEFVEFLGFHFDGDAFYDFDAEAFEAVDFFRVVREQADFFSAHVLENLGTDPVFAKVRSETEFFVGFDCIVALFLEDIGFEFIDEADATAFLAHVEEDAPAFGVDLCQGSGQLFTAVAAAGAEDVACKAFGMDAAQEVLAVADFAFDQSDVMFARQVVDVAVDLEIAVFRRHLGDGFADDVFVVAAAVVLEIVDGDEFQAVFVGDFPEVRRAHHRAVVCHDFAAQADLFESGQAHEVDRGFRVAVAGQDAAAFGDEGEVVARTAEVFGTGRFFSAFAGRQGAFDSRDARRRVDVVDGNGEGRFVVICIFADHLGQAELMGIFDAHGHADQALAVAGHEVHVFCRAVLGGADEVAFVFAVRVIGDDDDVAGL